LLTCVIIQTPMLVEQEKRLWKKWDIIHYRMSCAHHVHIWQVSLHNILSPFLSNSNRQHLIVKSRKTGLDEVQSDKEAGSKPADLISCKTSCFNSVRQSSSVAWGKLLSFAKKFSEQFWGSSFWVKNE
jgi:hypothetical protein